MLKIFDSINLTTFSLVFKEHFAYIFMVNLGIAQIPILMTQTVPEKKRESSRISSFHALDVKCSLFAEQKSRSTEHSPQVT